MAQINTSSIASLLRPGLAAVFGGYDTWNAEYKDIFEEYESNKNYEIETETRLLQAAQFKAEGAAGNYGTMGQTFQYSYQMQSFFAGFIISEEAIDDNQYKDQFPKTAKSLRDSMAETKNIEAANILNNGFSASYTGGDNVPLFSTQHPIYGDVVANTFNTAQQLNETSLAAAITAIGNFRQSSGNRAVVKPMKLIVPNALWTTAKVLLGSKFSPQTANNAINSVDDMFPGGYKINHYLTSPTAWFIKTDADNSLKHYVRKKMAVDTFLDIDTNSLKVRATERYAFGWSDFRGIFGSQGF